DALPALPTWIAGVPSLRLRGRLRRAGARERDDSAERAAAHEPAGPPSRASFGQRRRQRIEPLWIHRRRLSLVSSSPASDAQATADARCLAQISAAASSSDCRSVRSPLFG